MSGISSGIGLVSGIDTATLIDQLISLERQPVTNLQNRVTAIDVQRTAFLDLSAQLLALQSSSSSFGRASFFNRFSSSSTDENVLTATPGENAAEGSYTFQVRSLVTTHSLVSRGFADSDHTPIGVGELTFEVGQGRVSRSASLDSLRGGQGIRRGAFTITDRAGATADIDLTTALTIEDVLDRINSAEDLSVRAYVTSVATNGATGDRIVIEDLTGQTGDLIVADAGQGVAASDLGIAGTVAGSRIDGADLVWLARSTQLSVLNDGNGVGRFRTGSDLEFSTASGDFSVSLTKDLVHRLEMDPTDLRILNSGNGVRLGTIRITDRSGKSAEIDLSAARTLRDVLDAINGADVAVSAIPQQTNDDSIIQISDESGVPAEQENAPKLIIEDLTGFTAADLGVAGEFDNGIASGSDIYRIESIGDVINAINYAQGNNDLVQASLGENGNGLFLRGVGMSDSGEANTVTISAGSRGEPGSEIYSDAARDLGLLGADGDRTYQTRHLIGGLDTVLLQSLNGGSGVTTGEVRMTDRAGGTATVDLSDARTLRDVIDLINLADTVSLEASINSAGNGIVLHDSTRGTGGLLVQDMTGSTAADLGIAGLFDPQDGNDLDGGNLQLQYVSRQTLLSDLNAGRGVATGSFRMTDSTGAMHLVVLSGARMTVGDALDAINASGSQAIEARINDTGDGILVSDNTSGGLPLTIEDVEDGHAAEDLRLAGIASQQETSIDGSYEIRIEVGANDTLEDIALRINESGVGASASVLNHGGSSNPYSLTLTSGVTGRAGELMVDSVGVDLGLSTLSRAQDAVVTIGDDTTVAPRVVSGSSNTFENVIEGITLDLFSVSDDPVTVSVSQDLDGIVESLDRFASDYNGVMDAIERNTSFNEDTFERGPLLGDSTVSLVRSRLNRLINRPVEGVDASVSHLFSIGFRIRDGSRLTFDEERFREVYSESPKDVEKLFQQEETGFATVVKDVLDELTRDFDGVLSRKDSLLSDQQELLNERIASLNIMLEAKRARLEAQFVTLESTLAALQGQQTALASLQQL